MLQVEGDVHADRAMRKACGLWGGAEEVRRRSWAEQQLHWEERGGSRAREGWGRWQPTLGL